MFTEGDFGEHDVNEGVPLDHRHGFEQNAEQTAEALVSLKEARRQIQDARGSTVPRPGARCIVVLIGS